MQFISQNNKYMHNNNYPNYSHKYLIAEIKIKHKQIIINKRVWVKVTVVSMKMDTVVWCGWTTQPCAQKLNTALRAQVESSAMSELD